MNLVVVLLSCLVAVTVLMTVVALVARSIGRVVIVDIAWGGGFVLLALVAAVTGTNDIRWWLLVMVALWGGRLAWHVGQRVFATDEEDPRYATLLEGKPFSYAVVRVFLTQGVAMWFVLPPPAGGRGHGHQHVVRPGLDRLGPLGRRPRLRDDR